MTQEGVAYGQSEDLAAANPEKLAELVALFDEEAWKYNVYPLYDDMIKRIGAQQDRLFGDQEVFTYFAPGAVRIAEKSSAPCCFSFVEPRLWGP